MERAEPDNSTTAPQLAPRSLALITSFPLPVVAGCSKESEARKPPPGHPKATYEVGILGDESRLSLLKSLADAHSASVIDDGATKAADIRLGDVLFHVR